MKYLASELDNVGQFCSSFSHPPSLPFWAVIDKKRKFNVLTKFLWRENLTVDDKRRSTAHAPSATVSSYLRDLIGFNSKMDSARISVINLNTALKYFWHAMGQKHILPYIIKHFASRLPHMIKYLKIEPPSFFFFFFFFFFLIRWLYCTQRHNYCDCNRCTSS